MPLTAVSSRRTKPERAAATPIASTIRPMESAKVPSQSKISSLYSDRTQSLHRLGPHFIHRRLQLQLAAIGQRHGQHIGVKEQALAAQIADFLGETIVTVLAVAGNTVPGVQGVHTNLVGTTGDRLGLDHGGEITETAQYLEHRERLLALLVDLDHALAGAQVALEQGRAHLLDRSRPITTYQGHITFIDAVAAQRFVQMAQHAAFLGDHQQAGSIAIQAMDQFQLLGIRAQLTRSEEHTSELQSRFDLVCRLL